MDLEVVTTALEKLEQNAGIHAEWAKCAPAKLGYGIDGEIRIQINEETEHYYADVKKEIRKHHIPRLKEIADTVDHFILIVDRLFPNIKENLQEAGINWLDGAGNMYLKNKDFLIWIDQHTTTPKKETKNRAFTKTGLKVVFLFLHDEKWINKTYREIAETADVALGNITHVFDGLKEKGFLVKETPKKYKLVNRQKLLDRWVTAFADELKPRLHVGNYAFLGEGHQYPWNNLNLEYGEYWGGEPGADLLTDNLKPVEFLLYTDKQKPDLMNTYRLKPDPEGNVKVYKPYWKIETNMNDTHPAPPLVVYTDLMATGEPRNVNVANEIHERFLNHLT